jgi:hypothetical protein
MKSIEPGLEIRWDNRAFISFYVPGATRAWASFRTKDPAGLDCRFMGQKGQLNLSRVEGIGALSQIGKSRDGEVLRLVFQHDDHVQPQRLKQILVEHLQGFREVTAKK